MKSCTNKSKYIWGYLDGALTQLQRAKFERHMEECPACREELERCKSILRAQSGLSDVKLPEGFHDAWVSRLQKTGDELTAKRRISWKTAAGIAAALVVFTAGVLNFKEIFPARNFDENLAQKGSASNIIMENAAIAPSPAMDQAFAASDTATTSVPEQGSTDAAAASQPQAEQTHSTRGPAGEAAKSPTAQPAIKGNGPGTLTITNTEDAASGSIIITGLKYPNTRDEIKRKAEELGITFSEEGGQLFAVIAGDTWDPFISILKNELELEVTAIQGKTEKTLIVIE